MGGVAERYRSEAEHLLVELPGLLQLLKGKEWSRVRSLLQSKRQEAASALISPVSGPLTEAQPIPVAGHARPALPQLASGTRRASRPGPSAPVRPAGEQMVDGEEHDSAGRTEPPAEDAPTTITPILRQIVPS